MSNTQSITNNASQNNANGVVCRKRPRSPEKVTALVSECSICCDTWKSSGPHRIVTLSCGHLFGKSCIEKWLKTRKTCPSCNVSLAKKPQSHIIPLFTNSIGVENNAGFVELEALKKAERKKRGEMEAKFALLEVQHKLLIEKLNQKSNELKALQERMLLKPSSPILVVPVQEKSSTSNATTWDYKPMSVIPTTNSRVFAISKDLEKTCVGKSISSTSTHGILKFSTMFPEHAVNINLRHTSAVRDIDINSDDNNLALTTACDKKVIVTSLASDSIALEFNAGLPGWSCKWDSKNSNYFYVGCSGGVVKQFDLRSTAGAVTSFRNHPPEPIHSLTAVKHYSESTEIIAGFFSGSCIWSGLDKFQVDQTTHERPFSSTSSTCVSMSVNALCDNNNQFLYSSRNSSTSTDSHVVMNLNPETRSMEHLVEFSGHHKMPKYISRSCIWSLAGGKETLVASADDISKKLCVWSFITNSSRETTLLPRYLSSSSSPVLDVQHAVERNSWQHIGATAILGALTSNELQLLKYGRKNKED